MPKPTSKYISPKHVFDTELSKLPGERKQLQRKELAKRLKYPEDFESEEEMQDFMPTDDFMDQK